MFTSMIAPLILCLCALAFFWLGFSFRRAGRPGKAAFDFVCGFSLLVVLYYVMTEFR